jgi:hypothetical protein
MTVEELIEALRQMPPTSRVEIETEEYFVDIVGVKYERGVTSIGVETDEEDIA